MQLCNGAANAPNQLRDVEQIVFSLFLNTAGEMSVACSSAGRLFQVRGPWTAKLRSPYFVPRSRNDQLSCLCMLHL